MKKINKTQKLILAILIPIGIFLVFHPIAYYVGHQQYSEASEAFLLTKTWFIWFIYVSIIGFIEFKLFGNNVN
jgi:hypothetical protein